MATPYSLIRLEETESTQDDARRAHAGRAVVVVADRQTRGRGRSGSDWLNADRAVAVSVAVEPDWPVERRGVIPLVAGWSVWAAIDDRVRLKWPNDVLVGDRKVGGILVEARDDIVVAGLGLNLWWSHPPDQVGALREADPGPGEVERVGRVWAETLLDALSRPVDEWPAGEYRAVCSTLGRRIRWDPDGEGRAVGVAPDGALIVETATGRREIRSGAVRHVRGAEL